jgi:hypothetical protein
MLSNISPPKNKNDAFDYYTEHLLLKALTFSRIYFGESFVISIPLHYMYRVNESVVLVGGGDMWKRNRGRKTTLVYGQMSDNPPYAAFLANWLSAGDTLIDWG